MNRRNPTLRALLAAAALTFVAGTALPQLALAENLVQATGALEASDAESADGAKIDVYSVEVEANRTLIVTMTSRDFDTYISLRSAEGTLLRANDDSADATAGTNSRLEFFVETAGTFQIVATSLFGGELGTYTIAVSTIGVGE